MCLQGYFNKSTFGLLNGTFKLKANMGTIQKLANCSLLQESRLHMTVHNVSGDYYLGMWVGQATQLPFPPPHTHGLFFCLVLPRFC